MIKNALWKDIFRDIKKSKGRFISIASIIVLGVMLFTGVKIAPIDMKATADKYYDDYNLMDLKIISTLGLTDKDVKDIKDINSFRRDSIGFIFQFHQLLPEFTALENVCIPAFIANKSKVETEVEAKKLLTYLGLSHRMDHKPNELSGGEQQRVAVARALINKPAIIFADEPSGNLDTASAENLHQLFFKLRDELGQTFVIVTHNEELANMADRKLIMVDGLISN